VKEKFERTDKEVECNYGFIGKTYRNGVFQMIFTYPIEEDEDSLIEDEIEYKWFDYEIIKSIANGIAIAAYNVSVEEEYLGGSWIISLNDYDKAVTRNIYTTKWSNGIVKGGEARVILNIIWQINKQTEHLNRGRVVIHNNNMKLINKVNHRMK